MNKTYAFFTGIVIAVMLLVNSIMTKAVGNFAGIVMIHLVGLIGAALILLLTKTEIKSLKGISFVYLFGGTTGFFTVYFANLSFINLGATLTLMLTMFGQILMSTIVDHYGLLGMEKFPFNKWKLSGIALMIIGVVLIVLGGK